MKKINKFICVLAVLLCGTSVFAKSNSSSKSSSSGFDWSKCWCTYGGKLKNGNMLLNVNANVNYDFFTPFAVPNGWAIPTVVVELQGVNKVGELPFSFGGYATVKGSGYTNVSNLISTVGGVAAYHIHLPVEMLDTYVSAKAGFQFKITNDPFSVPFVPNFDFSTVVGANYFFSDNFGVNVEVGYPMISAGIAVKF